MEYKEFFSRALDAAEDRYPRSDIGTALGNIKARAGKMRKGGAEKTYNGDIDASYRDVSKSALCVYTAVRAAGAAAAVVLMVGAGVLLRNSRDKIAAPKDPDRPADVTTVSGTADVTPPAEEHGILYTPADLTYELEDKTVHIRGYEFDRMWCKLYMDITYDNGLPPRSSDFDVQISGNDGQTAHRFDPISERGSTVSYSAEVFDLKSAKYSSEIVFSEWDGSGSFTVPVEYSGIIPTVDLVMNRQVQSESGRMVTLKTISICPYMFGFEYLTDNADDITGNMKYRVILKNGEEIPVFCSRGIIDDDGRAFMQVLTGIPTDISDPDPQRINDRVISSDDIAEIYINNICVYGSQTYEMHPAETSLSFYLDNTFDLFESVFYGEWEPGEGNPDEGNIMLTYEEDMFTFENSIYPYGVTEADTFWVMPYMSGGVSRCFIIKKDQPDVMYNGWWDSTDMADTFTLVPTLGKYTRKPGITYDHRIHTGRIGVWGLHKLLIGAEQSAISAAFWQEANYRLPGGFDGEGFRIPGGFDGKGGFTDADGTEWVIATTKALPPSEIYYLGGDGITGLTLALRYYEKSAYDAYISEHIDDPQYAPAEQYFALNFTVSGDGICKVDYSPFDPDDLEGMIKVTEAADAVNISAEPLLDIEAVTADYTQAMITGYESDENWQ